MADCKVRRSIVHLDYVDVVVKFVKSNIWLVLPRLLMKVSLGAYAYYKRWVKFKDNDTNDDSGWLNLWYTDEFQ